MNKNIGFNITDACLIAAGFIGDIFTEKQHSATWRSDIGNVNKNNNSIGLHRGPWKGYLKLIQSMNVTYTYRTKTKQPSDHSIYNLYMSRHHIKPKNNVV